MQIGDDLSGNRLEVGDVVERAVEQRQAVAESHHDQVSVGHQVCDLVTLPAEVDERPLQRLSPQQIAPGRTRCTLTPLGAA